LNNDELLRPTLSEYRAGPALYNETGLALAAFLGGPVGAGVYGAANSFRLSRLKQELPVIVAAVAASFLLVFELERFGLLRELAQALDATGTSTLKITLRALGLACFGAIYLMQRRFYRAAQVSGVESLKGWIPGLAAVVLGYAANLAFAYGFLQHH